jgi:hypothetical protein
MGPRKHRTCEQPTAFFVRLPCRPSSASNVATSERRVHSTKLKHAFNRSPYFKSQVIRRRLGDPAQADLFDAH